MRFIFIACLFECLMVYDCSVTYVDVEILLTQYVVVSVAYVLSCTSLSVSLCVCVCWLQAR